MCLSLIINLAVDEVSYQLFVPGASAILIITTVSINSRHTHVSLVQNES